MSYTVDGMVLWPLLPNWKRKVTETLEFRTRVIGPTLTGMRQKRRMRIAPRRSIGFEVHPHHDSRRLLENIRFSQGKREWALPVWHDRQSLAADLAAGALSIPCATAGYDFAPGRFAVLRKNTVFTTEFEIVQIDSISVGSINLVNETQQSWPAGTFLYPIRNARLSDNSGNAILLNGEVSTLSVMFEVSEPCDWPDYDFPNYYRGRPVWEFKNDWRVQRSFGLNRIITDVDNDTSIPAYFDLPDKTFVSLDTAWRATDRPGNSAMRSALYALAGRYKTLWASTLADDLKIAGSVGSSSVSMPVTYCGYTLFGLGEEGRQDIRIELTNGAVYYRRVIASVEAGANETLTLDSALGVAVSPANVRRISFLMLVQQASDSITLTHETDANGVTLASLVFEGVIDPPSAPLAGAKYVSDENLKGLVTETGLSIITG